jgi:hypothetical protein
MTISQTDLDKIDSISDRAPAATAVAPPTRTIMRQESRGMPRVFATPSRNDEASRPAPVSLAVQPLGEADVDEPVESGDQRSNELPPLPAEAAIQSIGFGSKLEYSGPPFLITDIWQRNGSIAVFADSPSTADKIRDYMVSAVSGSIPGPPFAATSPTLQLVPSTERLGQAEERGFLKKVPKFQLPSAITKKNYVGDMERSLSLASPQVLSMIQKDFSVMRGDQPDTDLHLTQVVHLRKSGSDAKMSAADLSRAVMTLTTAEIPSCVCLVSVGTYDAASFPADLFDTIFVARSYRDEHNADSFSLHMVDSKFLARGELPPHVCTWSRDKDSWTCTPFVSDSPLLRQMAKLFAKGLTYEQIAVEVELKDRAAAYKSMAPLRDAGLLIRDNAK